jgi:hypothetical protein
VSLGEIEAAAALQDRVDLKYVVSLDAYEALAAQLRDTHAVLSIEDRRAFRYRTTYFDTPELRAFRDHVQQRRRRYKFRLREYLDSGIRAFEVKLKGSRGQTIKHRMPTDHAWDTELPEPARAFLRECLERSYGRSPEAELSPALVVSYTRVTLAAPDLQERVTCDFDLSFRAPDGSGGRLAPDAAIVESKSMRGGALADGVLRALGARPESACSKYCLGVGFTYPDVRSNGLRRLLRSHFVPAT